ncbi:pyridoxal-phosphate dependent enzyme [Streptomyces sp. NPDC088725]|uniref:pyridoxal-phosphate dependent enzyme n=1 Tax=Streptomyces sp. NPDC088725 TaxID=3365873 RepID=UPI0038172440
MGVLRRAVLLAGAGTAAGTALAAGRAVAADAGPPPGGAGGLARGEDWARTVICSTVTRTSAVGSTTGSGGSAPCRTGRHRCWSWSCRPACAARVLLVKNESVHPSGSHKHRLAEALFLNALANGWLVKESPVVEASSGSTVISEAWFCR